MSCSVRDMPSVAMMMRVRKDLPKYPARNEIINETQSHTDTAADSLV
jgi:hypothetical protein